MTRVRDAMLKDPRALDGGASAQEAARVLARPEVTSVLVVEGDRLLGRVATEELVAGVVAAGRDPRSTPLRELVERDVLTLEADLALDEGYRILEEADCERAPVVEDGRLVGVLSRSGVQRRLAEDEPPRGAESGAADPGAAPA